jgi:hypothetical protein
MRHIDRAPPGDTVRRTTNKSQSQQPRADLTRQKSKRNFFEDAFAVNPTSPARECVHGDAMVLAEVKTNVIVRSPCHLLCQLPLPLHTMPLTDSVTARSATNTPS